MKRLAAFLSTYWTRGEPGRPTPQSATVLMMRWWLAAFAFKLVGSSWDVAWHFHWLRDDFAPPHIINTVGTGIAIVLVMVHTFTGYGADKRSLRIMQTGTIIFVIAGPIDVINHRVNGLDITAWSPSHMLLYLGTAVMLAGVIRNWYLVYPRTGRYRWQFTAGLTALGAFMVENVFFPNYHQEYGITAISSWFTGKPYASDELLDFAAKQFKLPRGDVSTLHFALPIDPWVYPVWTVTLVVAVLVMMRIMISYRWAATIIMTSFVVFRMLIWPPLAYTVFPPSSVPFWLVGVGVATDLVFLARVRPAVRAVLGGVIVTAAAYGSLLAQTVAERTPVRLGFMSIEEMRATWEAGSALSTPPVDWVSIWWATPLAVACWLGVTRFADRSVGLDTPRPPVLTFQYGPEPLRDENGLLAGFAATDEDADAVDRNGEFATGTVRAADVGVDVPGRDAEPAS